MRATLSGIVRSWSLKRHSRRFSELTLPFREVNELVKPVQYNAFTGTGEQRDVVEPHVRKVKKAMESGEYTPTPVSVGLGAGHRKQVRFETLPDGTDVFRLDVRSENPLPLTDGGHRL
jgi:hypothetical protein